MSQDWVSGQKDGAEGENTILQDLCWNPGFPGRNGDPGETEVSRPVLRAAGSYVTSPVPSLLPLLAALSSVLGAPGTDTWLLLREQRESLLSTACARLQRLHLPEALLCPDCIDPT